MELPAPPGLRQPEDDLIRLTYRLWTEGGELVRLANCWIPRSRAAVEWTAAWFKAAEGDREIQWSGPFTRPAAEDDGVSATSGGSCGSAIEPCEVRGIDNCYDGCDEDDPWDPGDDDGGGHDPCYDCFPDEDPGGGGWNPGDSDGCDPDAIDGGCDESQVTEKPSDMPRDDMLDEEEAEEPKCPPNPSEIDERHAYCEGAVPAGQRLSRINAALDRIDAIGGECASLAKAGRDLLKEGTLRIFPRVRPDGSRRGYRGAAPRNGDWLIIVDDVVENSYAQIPGEGRYSIDWLLVHELDHHKGRHHVGHGTNQHDEWHTPNSRTCSKFDG